MVVFRPNGLQFAETRVLQVSDRFDISTVEIVLHDVVENFLLGLSVTLDKQKQKMLKNVVLYFVELEVIFAVF